VSASLNGVLNFERAHAKWTAFFVLGLLSASIITLFAWMFTLAALLHFAAPPD
jgi:hypothetical protein